MMGGSGIRCGAPIPKQFIQINNKEIYSYIIDGLDRLDSIDNIIVVVHKDWIEHVESYCKKAGLKKVYGVVAGGSTRSESVLNGLIKAKEFASDDDVVMMIDTTHPYVDEKGIKELSDAVREFGGATLGQRQYDTCYKIDENDMLTQVIPRQEIVSGASPEGFLFKTIYDIYTNSTKEELDKMTSAGAIALAHNVKMKVCTLNTVNLKITYPEDVEILKHLINYNFKGDNDEK
jgi:2-C-methyl-D-erythritol 4-phosphate cytidylyltransferase